MFCRIKWYIYFLWNRTVLVFWSKDRWNVCPYLSRQFDIGLLSQLSTIIVQSVLYFPRIKRVNPFEVRSVLQHLLITQVVTLTKWVFLFLHLVRFYFLLLYMKIYFIWCIHTFCTNLSCIRTVFCPRIK